MSSPIGSPVVLGIGVVGPGIIGFGQSPTALNESLASRVIASGTLEFLAPRTLEP